MSVRRWSIGTLGGQKFLGRRRRRDQPSKKLDASPTLRDQRGHPSERRNGRWQGRGTRQGPTIRSRRSVHPPSPDLTVRKDDFRSCRSASRVGSRAPTTTSPCRRRTPTVKPRDARASLLFETSGRRDCPVACMAAAKRQTPRSRACPNEYTGLCTAEPESAAPAAARRGWILVSNESQQGR